MNKNKTAAAIPVGITARCITVRGSGFVAMTVSARGPTSRSRLRRRLGPRLRLGSGANNDRNLCAGVLAKDKPNLLSWSCFLGARLVRGYG
jgi:hypothetical protein